ncbi:uncharacterized protein LOC133195437 [Saccostrea echinata]|uniref:uncharacterized protein LOC133195437 n=1 Tax=Saccostrea echinata TaxID=191078 RepID=UPI002A7ED6F5|nr:uncharacterized protein LOC133195437 [Saccostrea echinata]
MYDTMESLFHGTLSLLLILYGTYLPEVESRVFVTYNRGRTVTYSSYRRSQYNQSNSRLMWIFVGLFFGSIVLVLLCFFCYIKCKKKTQETENTVGNTVSVVRLPDTRYDINPPPRYSQTLEEGHQTLKVTDGASPPRYSDIINPPGNTVSSPGTSTTDSVSNSSAVASATADSISNSSPVASAAPRDIALGSNVSTHSSGTEDRPTPGDEDERKDEAHTPTHDKAGLIENEVDG